MEIDVSASAAPKGQDPDYYAVLLEPAHGMGEQDEFYVATRRLLMAGKAADGKLKRQVTQTSSSSNHLPAIDLPHLPSTQQQKLSY